MCKSSMSGNSEASAVTLFLQSMDAYSIIAAKGINYVLEEKVHNHIHLTFQEVHKNNAEKDLHVNNWK